MHNISEPWQVASVAQQLLLTRDPTLLVAWMGSISNYSEQLTYLIGTEYLPNWADLPLSLVYTYWKLAGTVGTMCPAVSSTEADLITRFCQTVLLWGHSCMLDLELCSVCPLKHRAWLSPNPPLSVHWLWLIAAGVNGSHCCLSVQWERATAIGHSAGLRWGSDNYKVELGATYRIFFTLLQIVH